MVYWALIHTLLFAVAGFAHPQANDTFKYDYSIRGRNPAPNTHFSTSSYSERFPDIAAAFDGNKRFMANRDSALFQSLVQNGQKPPFMMVACSDSRASESIFDLAFGNFFMERNIANQFRLDDFNTQSVMSYGVYALGAQHIVILGHYSCGGVAASIATPPKAPIDVPTQIVHTWISDIRSLYLSSNRTEVAQMRIANEIKEASGGTVPPPGIRDPGFRALVEENVKLQVQKVVDSPVIKNRFAEIVQRLNPDGTPKPSEQDSHHQRRGETGSIRPLFVHGWVHDLETGEVIDLNVSRGPPGFENYTPSSDGSSHPPPASS